MSSNFRIEDRINMNDKDITMVKGDTLAFGVEIYDEDGALMDITSAEFVARQTYNSQTALFRKTLGDGIAKVEDGIYSVRVAPSDTSSAEPGEYYYDFRVGVGDDIYTIWKGLLILQAKVVGG